MLVIAAVGVMIRLGMWQLDRLEQRRAFNARVSQQIAQPPLTLNAETLHLDLENMEYRQVIVQGEYDPEYEVALRNQVWGNRLGVDLITPLRIAGTDQAVLINRGWIPADLYTPGEGQQFAQTGQVTVYGVLRRSQSQPDIGRRSDPTPLPGERLLAWNLLNVARIAEQTPYELLPVYIQRVPDDSLPANQAAWTIEHLPFPSEPDLDLTEGPHLGYAIQWFTFAAILTIGYPIFLSRQSKETQ